MSTRFRDWIDANYPTAASALKQCEIATLNMVTVFPELRRAKGHVNGVAHWWCVTQSGEIIDPTAKQFVGRSLSYREYIGEEPFGKCHNCGAYLYTSQDGRNHFCRPCISVGHTHI